MPVVAIALGSNLGDRRAHLERAIAQLITLLSSARVSTVIETSPVDVPDPQPPYLNAALVGETSLSAGNLMARLLAIERDEGRERRSPRAARTLDLDLILYGDMILETPSLVVPHPRFRERRFVLQPLSEIAPDLRDPRTGETVSAMLAGLRG